MKIFTQKKSDTGAVTASHLTLEYTGIHAGPVAAKQAKPSTVHHSLTAGMRYLC